MKQIRRGIGRIGPQSPLGLQLKALLIGAEDEVESFLAAAEKWFDDSMDRVSGWYKRNAQKISIVAAVVVTLALNAGAVRVAERLSDDPSVRAAVVAQAEAAVEEGKAEEGEPSQPQKAGEQVQTAFDKLDSRQLPLLWSDANSPFGSWTVFALTLPAWIITAIAISLGAPFWFDALSKLAHLRTTGKKPEPKSEDTP